MVNWPLNAGAGLSPAVNTAFSSALTATPLGRGNGISDITVDNLGAKAKYWTTNAQADVVDYYEICLTPEPGATLLIDVLHLKETRSLSGITRFRVMWSDDDFKTSQLVGEAQIDANDIDVRTHNFTNLGIYTCNDKPVCFRLFGSGAVLDEGVWRIGDNSLRVEGQAMTSCNAPITPTAAIQFDDVSNTAMEANITNGSGTHRVVIMKAGAAVTATPCNTAGYQADATFGAGQEIAPDEFVVYAGPATSGNTTTFMVDGLRDGVTYHAAVFEYNDADKCYCWDNPARTQRTTDCIVPTSAVDLRASGVNMEATLAWAQPDCYDEVLLMASEAEVTGIPTGDGSNYQPNATFGQGTHSGGDFPANMFPVYKGVGDRIVVTGLTENQTCHFRLFARRGLTWAAGAAVQTIVREGCTELSGDVVFINELHYTNLGADRDEGVELFGPAGTDLSHYSLHFYMRVGNVNVTYKIAKPTGTIPDQNSGYGTLWIPVPDLHDGVGGVALYNEVTGRVVEFLCYRQGGFTTEEGVAAGMTAVPIKDGNAFMWQNGVTNGADQTLQRGGNGLCPSSDQAWGLLPDSRGSFNVNQSLLPITLLNFSALVVEGQVKLLWRTASEMDNDYMTVERSADGRTFTSIGRVQGAGTSATPRHYELWDHQPLPGRNYYRLSQTDYDGTTTYHRIVVVQLTGKGNDLVLFPTVATDAVQLGFGGGLPGDTRLILVDMLGRPRTNALLPKGTATHTIDVAGLEAGHYFVRVEQGAEVSVKRFVKVN